MKTMLNAILATGLVLCFGCSSDDSNPQGTADGGTDGGGQTDSAGPGPDGGRRADSGAVNACTAAITAKQDQLIKAGAVTEDGIKSWPREDAEEMVAADPTAAVKAATDGSGNYWDEGGISGKYWDDLAEHPGCEPRTAYTANTDIFNVTVDTSKTPPALVELNDADVPAGVPANSADDKTGLLAGFPCAAKIYDGRDSGVDESLPIVILQHGNSGSPNHFEEFHSNALAGTEVTTLGDFKFTVATAAVPSLARKLVEAGYQVIASDFRVDKVRALDGVNLAASEPTDPSFGDAFGNIDHGWGTPILQSMLEALLKNTDKKISIVGHSYGYSVVRDALRRTYRKFKAGELDTNPYARIKDLVLMSGTAHGVANGKAECATRTNLRSKVNCQMGDRDNYEPTEFNKRLNGPNDLFSTPCADGSYAYGETDQCGGNAISYTTVTMKDLEGGRYQDEYVSEGASRLNLEPCVDNRTISTENGYDASGFMLGGTLLANHLGTIRSQEGIQLVLDVLAGK